MKIYEAWHMPLNGDFGNHTTIGYFLNKEDAQAAACRQEYCIAGILDRPGSVTEHEAHESRQSFDDARLNCLRKQALAKLSPEERQVLGL